MADRPVLTGTRRALGGFRPSGALAVVVPFLAYTTVFLLIPTIVVVVGAFVDGSGRPTLDNICLLYTSRCV